MATACSASRCSERVRSASAEGRALRVRGGGTKDWYGQTLEGEILDTRAYRGIVAYDPAELIRKNFRGVMCGQKGATFAWPASARFEGI